MGDFNSCCAWDPQDTFLNPGTRKGKTPKPVQSLLPLSYPDRQSPAIPGKVVPGGIRSSSSPPESPQGSRSSRGCRSSSSHICTTDIVLVSPPQQGSGQPGHPPLQPPAQLQGMLPLRGFRAHPSTVGQGRSQPGSRASTGSGMARKGHGRVWDVTAQLEARAAPAPSPSASLDTGKPQTRPR